MIKLVVSDIDGTLLPEGTDKINPKLYDAIRELKRRDILFAAASGRQYASMLSVLRPVADDIIFIAENGTNVMCRGRNISCEYIDAEVAEEVVRCLRGLPDCKTTLSIPETMYIEDKDPAFLKLLTDGYHNEMAVVDDLIPYCKMTNKLSVYRADGVDKIEKEIMERFGGRLHITVSGRIWIDFMKPGTDKGNALATIQRQMHIGVEETMAFGDNCNDIGMLARAGESYAVAGAHPQLKECAKHIAPPIEEDGVLRMLQETLLS